MGRHSRGTTAGDITAVSVPTLVGIDGLDTPDFRDIAHRYAALVEFAAAGHLVALDASAELTTALGPFLAR
ncbi:hypothetical protein ACIRBZ_15325 [Streptomyces sp. NPDC094038]|uniref:hypothetical protein n=1 Tax=Streptomyces sp. NPDC094038 TaxID=3366055 RepID=UPI0038075560